MALQPTIWALGFATAVAGYRAPNGAGRARFALGLWLGVVCAHLGWTLFQLPEVVADPGRFLQPGAVSILFFPLGVLLVAPWREALAALPLALGVARLACLPYDCCYTSPWNALPELGGWVLLHFGARRWPRLTTPIVLCGFGAIRLLSLPLRGDPVVSPFVEPAWIALGWIAAGLLLRSRIGSADAAREWFTERTEPLLRTLVLMLVVWLLFPLSAGLIADPTTAILAGSLSALALLAGLRRPLVPRISATSLAVLGGSLLVGVGVASLADAGLRQLGLAAPVRPESASGLARAFALVVLAPLFEELLYRERVLGVLRELWGWCPALVGSSALFALGHTDVAVMPIAFAGGLVCGLVMLRSGSLAAVIGLHAGWNLGVTGV